MARRRAHVHWFDPASGQRVRLTMSDWPYPLWIAHRGAGKLAPENTLAAFRLGASLRLPRLRMRRQASADGVPFLLHDDTLERTTSGHGPRRRRSLGRAVRGSTPAAGTAACLPASRIASLESVAAYCSATASRSTWRSSPRRASRRETGRAVGEWVRRLWRGTPPLLSSFRPDALAARRATAPDLPRALLLDTLWPGCMDMAASLGCVAVITDHELMDAALLGADPRRRLPRDGLHRQR